METKKNRDQDAEKLRIPLIFSGLLFTGGLLLASFTFSTPVGGELEAAIASNSNEVKYLQEDEKVDKPAPEPEEQTYVAPPQPDIRIDSNITTPPITVVTPPSPPIITIAPPVLPAPDPIADFPDVEAEFPGGAGEMMSWIGNNVVYPEISIQMEEQGKVYLSFIVEKDGSITGINVEKSVSTELDREAKRLLRNMPSWTPGEIAGKRVRTRCRLPIVFTLQ